MNPQSIDAMNLANCIPLSQEEIDRYLNMGRVEQKRYILKTELNPRQQIQLYEAFEGWRNNVYQNWTEEEKEKFKVAIEEEFNQAIRETRKYLSDDMVYTLQKQGFWATIMIACTKSITDEVDWAAVNIINGESFLYINPISFVTLEKRERVAVLIHEIMHLAFFHVIRREDRDPKLWNIACDIVVNQLIPKTSEIHLPKWVIYHDSPNINLPAGKSVEEYFELLKEKKKKGELSNIQLPSLSDILSGGGGTQGEGPENPMSRPNSGGMGDDEKDWHAKWSQCEGSKRINEGKLKKLILDAIRKEPGSLQGNAKSIIQEIIESKVNWAARLSVFMGKFVKHSKLSTFKKENRRLGELAKGRRTKKRLHVWIFVDTSASVSDEDLARFNGEIKKIYKTGAKITLVMVDTDIQSIEEYKGNIKRVEYKGRGGTSLIPPFEHVKNNKEECDVIVYLTDGGGQAPDKCDIPTMWVLVPKGVIPFDSNRKPIKWGTFVHIA